MKDLIKKRWKEVILFLISSFMLFLSFQFNAFSIAENNWFNKFQDDSEALVIGRLVKSNKDGILSDSGRLGRFNDLTGSWVSNQTLIYKNNLPVEQYGSYSSQFALQGLYFSLADKVLNVLKINPDNKVKILHAMTSMLFAIILSIIIILFYLEIGLFPSFFLLIGILFSQWLVVMGRNLYWVYGLMYLPFLATFIACKYKEVNHKINQALFYSVIYFAVFIKSLNGYEYISTVLIAMVSPIIYFSIKNNWSMFKAIQKIFYTGLFGFLGFISALMMHIAQLYTITHSITKSWDIIFARILVRTYGTVSETSVYYKSLTASVFEVYHKYFNGTTIEFSNFTHFKFFHTVTFEDLLWLFLLVTVLSFTKFKYIEKNSRKLIALSSAMWFSLLAPISWFTLAKGHSYIHTHINFVLWYLPFVLFGFALVGYVFYLIWISLSKKYKYIYLGTFTTIVIFNIINFINITKENDSQISNILKKDRLIEVSPKKNIKLIVTSDNKLIYYIDNCKNIDTKDRFFLHIYPKNNKHLINKKYPFNNFDFSWKQHNVKVSKFSKYKNSCIAVKNLPNYPIESITAGRYKGSKRFWKKKFKFELERKEILSAFNLSNNNWQNGISKERAIFFIQNTLNNRNSIHKKDILEFSSAGERKITKITYSDKYINIDVNGSKLDPIKDGYPNKIQIIKQGSY
ncbi:MAG: hypothetical protein KAI79_06725 [Bacteroidales bacterium]|nr:hypothetical protein [Bacteroidales bacterium]